MEGTRNIRWRSIVIAASAGILVVLALGVMAGTAFAQNTTGDPARGKYIFEAAVGCGCHGPNLAGFKEGGPTTLPASAPFGQRFDGPFGSVTTKNLTPDKETGLGNWTDEQIINAIRNGKDNQGKQLFPIMPFNSYHFMSDQDARDLVAYLRSVPAVKNPVPENKLNGPVPPAPQLPPSPATSPTGNGPDRGKYLVTGVSICGDCHTPTNADGSPDMSKMLAGSSLEGQIAPNITPDKATGIGNWSEQQIVTLLKTGVKPDGGHVQGLMAGIIGPPGFADFTDADAQAIAAYLKTIPAVNNVPQAEAPAAQAGSTPAAGGAATPAAGGAAGGAAATPAAGAAPSTMPTTGAEIPAGLATLTLLGAAAGTLGLSLRRRRR